MRISLLRVYEKKIEGNIRRPLLKWDNIVDEYYRELADKGLNVQRMSSGKGKIRNSSAIISHSGKAPEKGHRTEALSRQRALVRFIYALRFGFHQVSTVLTLRMGKVETNSRMRSRSGGR